MLSIYENNLHFHSKTLGNILSENFSAFWTGDCEGSLPIIILVFRSLSLTTQWFGSSVPKRVNTEKICRVWVQ